MLHVGEASRRLGVNPQTLYFYERIGLIPPPKRTDTGYRLFDEQDIERLSFISRAKTLGLTLDEIKELLTLQEGKTLSCQEVYERLFKKLQQIDENIRQLQALRDELIPLLEIAQKNANCTEQGSQCVLLKPTNP